MDVLFNLADIHYSYPDGHTVLTGAKFALVGGERLCLTGHNGAGKSTLFHIMVGLIQPQSGTVEAFGKIRGTEADFREVRQRAGLVFQDPDDQLFCPTVADDIAFGPLNLGKSREEALAIVEETLNQLNLGKFRDRVTHKLSGGEKRLVSLASVLAMKPDVLLLDEPTNALDEGTTEHLVDILCNLPQAMVVISHDPHFRTRIGTRTLKLQDGRIEELQPKCRHAADTA
ncbi:energy-coupling factor ABC transporter ATP-binding protein [Coralliovum pocilloporae]|uniref:energy-coupling factor ABC transporter ATP-binding protein n=1 Tax=Coralliovum pocilloporae TaxID=3066369 RepID=UPI003307B6C2